MTRSAVTSARCAILVVCGALASGAAAQPAAGYDKGFFVQSAEGDYKLVIQGRVQVRYAYLATERGDDPSAFSIERARLTLKGHAFDPDLQYKMQADFEKGLVSLKDFYVDYVVSPERFVLRAGQWKRPFSRQQITSSGNQALVDRATRP